MRLFDVMKPAVEWSEAAMLPARPRTLSQGAALRQLTRTGDFETESVMQQTQQPAFAGDQLHRAMRRAAYAQVRRLF